MASWRQWFRMLVILLAFPQTILAVMSFQNPPSGAYNENYENNAVYNIGDIVGVSWTGGSKQMMSSISLWQIDPATRKWMEGETGEYLSQSARGSSGYTWTVATSKNLTKSNVFFLAMFQEGRSISDSMTHAFNISHINSSQTEDISRSQQDRNRMTAGGIEIDDEGQDQAAEQNIKGTSTTEGAGAVTGKQKIGTADSVGQDDSETQVPGSAATPTATSRVDEDTSHSSVKTESDLEGTTLPRLTGNTDMGNDASDDDKADEHNKGNPLEDNIPEQPDNNLGETDENTSEGLTAGVIAGITIGAVFIASTAAVVCVVLIARMRQPPKPVESTEQDDIQTLGSDEHETKSPVNVYWHRVKLVSSQQHCYELEGDNCYGER